MAIPVKLTDRQMLQLKEILLYAGEVSDEIQGMIHQAKLDEIDGNHLLIAISNDFISIDYGYDNHDSGRILLGRLDCEDHYTPVGRNSTEYEMLFAEPELRERMLKVLQTEKELPPDGLWISSYDDPPAFD